MTGTDTTDPAAAAGSAGADPPPAPVKHSRFRVWLLEGMIDQRGDHPGPEQRPSPQHVPHSWWKVMCLTGVDYFSTLGYQPGIAALAAGLLSPLATVVLVLLTLFGALPVYRRVARESFRGEGSIAMLERLLPRWVGKLFVLALLGFAATDFLITMTLSAADATEHLVSNPLVPESWHNYNLLITLALLALLGGVFLRGFAEAIGIAVLLVVVYLALNLVVVVVGLGHVITSPVLVSDWRSALSTNYSGPWVMVGIALLVFPKLALGLSGFETGVAVMPQVAGADGDLEDHPGRKDPRHPAAADHRRGDHERLPDHLQHHHHGAHPAGRVPAGG